MTVVILSIMCKFKTLSFRPLLDLDRTGDFRINCMTNLLVPN